MGPHRDLASAEVEVADTGFSELVQPKARAGTEHD
jgi:hypothetical protein